MAYVPAESSLGDPSSTRGAGSGTPAAPTPFGPTHDPSSAAHLRSLSGITRLIRGLDSEETREQSLELLTKCKQTCDDLAILLWNSFGTMKLLLLEITSLYRPLLSNSLSERAAIQVCNAIALLQKELSWRGENKFTVIVAYFNMLKNGAKNLEDNSGSVAAHPATRIPFVKASIPVYLYPFLNTMNREKSYEYLRLTSLSVIGSLAKVDDAEVVDYLLYTQIFPSCLRCMEVGATLSKTVATFIIHRILLNEKGLKYCFILADRYLSVSHALAKMVDGLAEEDEVNLPKLLRNIIGCYLRLSENERTCERLSAYIPTKLVDNTYIHILRGDPEAFGNLQQLICNLNNSQRSRIQPSGEPLGPSIK